MADLSPLEVPPVVLEGAAAEQLTSDQLRGEKCWRDTDCCGPFVPVGHAYTAPAEPGAPLGWAVVACRRHREAA